MKLGISARSSTMLLLAALCVAAMIQTSASQSNTTSVVSATAAPGTPSRQINTNSNTTLPSEFTAATTLISVRKPITQAAIKPPKDWSSEEIFDHDDKPERGSEQKKRKKEKKRKRKGA